LFLSQTFAVNMQIKTALFIIAAGLVSTAQSARDCFVFYHSDDCSGNISSPPSWSHDGECDSGPNINVCTPDLTSHQTWQFTDSSCNGTAKAVSTTVNQCTQTSTGSLARFCSTSTDYRDGWPHSMDQTKNTTTLSH
jgi:hypothetical protein